MWQSLKLAYQTQTLSVRRFSVDMRVDDNLHFPTATGISSSGAVAMTVLHIYSVTLTTDGKV